MGNSNAMSAVKTWLRDTYTEHRFQKAERIPRSKKRMDAVILVLAGVSVLLFVYEWTSSTYPAILNQLSILLDLIFLLDYLLRLYFSGAQGQDGFTWTKASNHYAYRWYGIVDWIAVFPPLLTHVFHVGLGVDQFSRISRFFRIARMTRVLRVLRTLRLVQESERFSENIQEYRKKLSRELLGSFLFVVFSMFLGVVGIYYAEQGTGSDFQNLGETVYWSVLSVMGQADGSGFTNWISRSIAVMIIFIGIAFFGIVAGSITTFFMDNMSKQMQGRDKYDGKGHVIICGWNSKISELMQHLRKVPDLKVVLLLFDRGNPEEDIAEFDKLQNPHTGEYLSAFWIRGNPRSTDDLNRANVLEAKSVIVLSDYSKTNLDEDDIDARSLMTLEMIHEIKVDAQWGAGRAGEELSGAEVTVELLTMQSIPLARKYAHHVVYADDLICQYITLDTQSREAGQVYERLIDPTDQNVYLMDITRLESQNGRGFIGEIDSKFKAHALLFLGLHISDELLVRFARGNKALYDLIKQADLLEAAEGILKGQYGVSLLSYVENPPKEMHRKNGSGRGMTILNPLARHELMEYMLQQLSESSYPPGSLKAIGMSGKYPKGLEL